MPGVILGAYPEQQKPRLAGGLLDQLCAKLAGQGWLLRRRQAHYAAAAQRVITHASQLVRLDTAALLAELQRVRAEVARDGLDSAGAERCMAVVMLAIRATSGRNLRHNQIMAALVVLRGGLAEVPTGEGKTLATAAAACVAALAGIPVHIVTSNDYLAARDAQHMLPLSHRLGLSVAAIAPAMGALERRRCYAANITFCSAKELVFDYLRDRLQAPPSLTRQPGEAGRVLRGLCMAIIDEADSVLIDEAITPFILSESYAEPEQQAACVHALRIAAQLRPGFDFRLDTRDGQIELGPTATAALLDTHDQDATGALWRIPRYRQEMVELAIRAVHLFKRDEHYLVRDGAIHLIDSTSGRIASGRAWSRGLHQMVEIKERCKPTPATRVLAQITFQRFFTRYLRLGGMSGTLREAGAELQQNYGLRVIPIPAHKPSALHIARPLIFASAQARWRHVIGEITRRHRQGLPVLVGTDSVRESEHLSRLLDQAALPHCVLNARQDSREAELIAAAGQPGAITVTTNMAGRGTDILIDETVARHGGLQVLSCQHNSARRIDRQLFGRAGRLGQAGWGGAILSLEEGLLGRYLSPRLRRLLAGFSSADGTMPLVLSGLLVWHTQRQEERRSATARRHLFEQDRKQGSQQLFGASPE